MILRTRRKNAPQVPSVRSAFSQQRSQLSRGGIDRAVNSQRIQHILTGARVTVALVVGIIGVAVVYGLADNAEVDIANIWRGLTLLILALGFLAVIEVVAAWGQEILAGQARVICAQPKARQLVAATLQELEAEAAQEAGVPRIVGGERLR